MCTWVRRQSLHHLLHKLAVVCGKAAMHRVGGVRDAQHVHVVTTYDHADALQVEYHSLLSNQNGSWVRSIHLRIKEITAITEGQ